MRSSLQYSFNLLKSITHIFTTLNFHILQNVNKNTLALFCFNPAILSYNFISFKSHADVFNDNVQACNLNHFMSVTFFFFQYDDISLNNCILLSDHGPFKTTVKNSFVYLHYSISFFKFFFFAASFFGVIVSGFYSILYSTASEQLWSPISVKGSFISHLKKYLWWSFISSKVVW